MPPVICIVGRSNSGKTTLVEKLLPELRARGYRIATAKHAQEIDIDRPGTDSARHLQAGSEAVVLASNEELAMMRGLTAAPTLDEVVRLLGEDCDLIIAEGFKSESAPKIEVQRSATGPLLTDLKGLFAVVTDEPVDTPVRRFSFSQIRELADLIEAGFIKPNPEHVSVYVNGRPVSLGSFPREFVKNISLALAASLKGADEPRTMEIRIRKP